MTVCIGAISRPMVIVASDRMITSGDIQFEQQQPKIFTVAPKTLALISGDIAVQTELVEKTRAEAKRRASLTVADVAQIFADAYGDYCRRKAERLILKPIGIDSVDALIKKKWPAEITRDYLDQVRATSDDDGIATIIAGTDDDGPHLYVIDRPGGFMTSDRIGFASVGIGQRHAESQFMFAGYTPQWQFPDALYLTYVAKRRAEVAPGVGLYTDLAVITSGANGDIVPLDRDFVPELQKIYDAEQTQSRLLRDTAIKNLDLTLQKILKVPPKPSTDPPRQSDSVAQDQSGQQAPQPTTHGPKAQPPSLE